MIGAPLLSREFEHGTWRMAWSQTVPRTRWLVSKLALVSAGLILLGVAMTAVFTWYRGPMDRVAGHLTYAAFDFEGLALTAYLLSAFAFAVLAGMLLRRSTAAMAAAFAVWVAIRGFVDFWLRPRSEAPIRLRISPSVNIHFGPSVAPPMTGHFGDWVLGAGTTAGQRWIGYQPASRFWTFQCSSRQVCTSHWRSWRSARRSGCCAGAPGDRRRAGHKPSRAPVGPPGPDGPALVAPAGGSAQTAARSAYRWRI
jgi:hypothetical protein